VRRANAPKRLSSLLAVLVLTGCAIAPPTPRAPIDAEARRVVDRLTVRWQEFHDLRALADATLKKGSERQRLSGVLLARAPASVRFEALSPFGQPFLLVTMHDGRITAYNATTNEARVGPATVETAADLLSLPVEPDDLVALLSGRAAPHDALERIASLPNLSVLPAGAAPPNPQDLLARPAFAQFLRQAGAQSDVVLIDSPAAGASTDAQTIAVRAGAALVVVRRHSSRLWRVQGISASVGEAQARIVGAVLNER